MTDTDHRWPTPAGLSPDGKIAAQTIRTFLIEKGFADDADGNRFYSPDEWRERGETYGTESLLIFTFDGSPAAALFNWAYETPGQGELIEELNKRLQHNGMFFENGTHWYAAVYPISP